MRLRVARTPARAFMPICPAPTIQPIARAQHSNDGRSAVDAAIHRLAGRDHPEMIAGAQWIEQNLPQFGTSTQEHPTGDRNAYYWYYGTQIMFQMQGRYWQDWNARLRPLLLESQTTSGELAGSWDPVYPLPDRYGYMVGRLYVTTLHLLVLEVYYRHLPIYQTLEQAPAGR